MQKRIAFIVGHESWGKSETLRAIKDISAWNGRRVTIHGTEFLVRGMSNDDRPISFINFMDTTKRPAIIAALCPKFEALNGDSPNKTIDGTLRLLRQSHYGVTGSMRWSWVRLSLFDELQSRATSGGNRS